MNNRGIPILVLLLVFSFLNAAPGYPQDGGDVYVIKRGDTLWDLSGEYLDDPYEWPELWQRNQYITNPHLIYPGNSLRLHGRPPSIRPGTVEEAERPAGAVTEAQPISEKAKAREGQEEIEESAVSAVAGEKEESVVARKEEVVPSSEEVEQPVRAEGDEIIQVIRKGGVEYVILEGESLGKIIDARYEKRLLAQGDTVYLAMKERTPEVGDKFLIFRTTKTLKNPYTRKKWKKIYLLGALKVRAVKGPLYQAMITDSLDSILRGDEVMTYRAIE